MALDSDSIFSGGINDSMFSGGGGAKSLEDLMLALKVKAAYDAKIRSFNDFCWDVCIEKPGSKLDQKTATCLTNCVDRFIDVTHFISQRIIALQQS